MKKLTQPGTLGRVCVLNFISDFFFFFFCSSVTAVFDPYEFHM